MFNNSNSSKSGNTMNTTRNNSNSLSKRVSNFFSSERVTGQNVLKIILILLIMVIIVGVTIWIIVRLKRGSKRETDLTKNEKLVQLDSKKNIPMTISSDDMPPPAMGNDYTLNFWIYLSENYQSSADHKIVFYRGVKDGTAASPLVLNPSSPVVAMNKDSNKMHIAVATTQATSPDSLDDIFFSGDKKYLRTTIDYIPQQQWVNVTVMVIDNILRVYLDGDIYSVASTSEIPGSPGLQTNEEDITVGSSSQSLNVQGFFAHFRYFNHSIPQNQIRTIYRNGPTSKSLFSMFGLGQYGLQSPIYKIE